MQEVATQQFVDRFADTTITFDGTLKPARSQLAAPIQSLISEERAGCIVVFLNEIGYLDDFTDD